MERRDERRGGGVLSGSRWRRWRRGGGGCDVDMCVSVTVAKWFWSCFCGLTDFDDIIYVIKHWRHAQARY